MRSPGRGMRPKAVGHQAPHRAHVARRPPAAPRAPAPGGPRCTRPATSTAPSGSTMIGSASTSYSSLISPTISSTMSSTVTQPRGAAVLVDHDREGDAPAWNSFSSSAIFFVSGHQEDRAHQRLQRVGVGALVLDEVAHHDHAHDVVQVLAEDRDAAVLGLAHRCGAGRHGRADAAMATMSGRGVITSRTWVAAKRATASTSRPSSASCTGAGGTSGPACVGALVAAVVRARCGPRRRAQRAHQRRQSAARRRRRRAAAAAATAPGSGAPACRAGSGGRAAGR